MRAAPEVASVSALAEKWRTPEKDEERTRAPVAEWSSVPSERTLQGARRRGLEAPVQSASAGGDASGACPNWASISASL